MRSALCLMLLAGVAYADADGGAPPPKPAAPSVLDDPDRPADPPDARRLWWTFPNDDATAIEIDAADLRAFARPRAQLVKLVETCDKKRAAKLIAARDGGATTPLRELRLDTPGEPVPGRCINTLAIWKKRLGGTFTERVEDELDAHLSFLLPRQRPKAAPVTPNPP